MDDDENTLAEFGVRAGEPSLVLFDSQKRPRCTLEASRKAGVLRLFEKDGEILFSKP
jgi:hypothetical protein